MEVDEEVLESPDQPVAQPQGWFPSSAIGFVPSGHEEAAPVVDFEEQLEEPRGRSPVKTSAKKSATKVKTPAKGSAKPSVAKSEVKRSASKSAAKKTPAKQEI